MLFGGNQDAIFENRFQLARKIAGVLCATNISGNFLLYFLMHQPFRNGAKELFCGVKDENSEKETDKCECQNNEVKIEICVLSDNLVEHKCDSKIILLKKMLFKRIFGSWL